MFFFKFSPTDWESFFVSFWAGVWSGLVTGIVTGLVVGVAILLITNRAQKRSAQRQYEKEIEVFVQNIPYLFLTPGSINIGERLKKVLEPPIVALLSELDSRPLQLWLENSTKHRALMELLVNLRSSYLKFAIQAEHLDSLLVAEVRKLYAEKGIFPVNDEMLIKWAKGRLYGFSPEEIAPWLKMGSSDPSDRLEPEFKTLFGLEHLKEARATFDSGKGELLQIFERVRNAVESAQ